MANFGKKAGGEPKPSGRNKRQDKGVQVNLGKKASTRPRGSRRGAVDPEDAPLDPNTMYEEDSEERVVGGSASPVEPFSDGIVSDKLQGLTVIPRSGGEDIAVLHDFLYLFAKTETFIGTISSKTSFMKKAGGRLL